MTPIAFLRPRMERLVLPIPRQGRGTLFRALLSILFKAFRRRARQRQQDLWSAVSVDVERRSFIYVMKNSLLP